MVAFIGKKGLPVYYRCGQCYGEVDGEQGTCDGCGAKLEPCGTAQPVPAATDGNRQA